MQSQNQTVPVNPTNPEPVVPLEILEERIRQQGELIRQSKMARVGDIRRAVEVLIQFAANNPSMVRPSNESEDENE